MFVFFNLFQGMVSVNNSNNDSGPIELKLLCGADVLESFAKPGVWKPEHVCIVIILKESLLVKWISEHIRCVCYKNSILIKFFNWNTWWNPVIVICYFFVFLDCHFVPECFGNKFAIIFFGRWKKL